MIAAMAIILWYLSGVTLFVTALYISDPVITRRDAMVSLFAGIFGPINFIYVIGTAGEGARRGSFWDKPVWPRPPRSGSGEHG